MSETFDDSAAQELEHSLLFTIDLIAKRTGDPQAVMNILAVVLPSVVAKALFKYAAPDALPELAQWVCDLFPDNMRLTLWNLTEDAQGGDTDD